MGAEFRLSRARVTHPSWSSLCGHLKSSGDSPADPGAGARRRQAARPSASGWSLSQKRRHSGIDRRGHPLDLGQRLPAGVALGAGPPPVRLGRVLLSELSEPSEALISLVFCSDGSSDSKEGLSELSKELSEQLSKPNPLVLFSFGRLTVRTVLSPLYLAGAAG